MRNEAAHTGGANSPPHVSARTEALAGWSVARHARLDSTNLEAKRIVAAYAEAGRAPEKTLIIAAEQTNGQCRHDRLWESSKGKGLWVSFILPVTVPPEALPQSTLVLGVAVRDGVREATGIALAAKWPNDLLGGGKKCCGLLVETGAVTGGSTPTPLILGAGINCAHGENDFPVYLRDTATSLTILADGDEPDPEMILGAIARNVENWFAVWQEQGFSPVRDAWLAGNCTIGKTVLLPEGYGDSMGMAAGLDDTGALLVRAAHGAAVRVDSGEILFAETRAENKTDGCALRTNAAY